MTKDVFNLNKLKRNRYFIKGLNISLILHFHHILALVYAFILFGIDPSL